MPRSSDPATGNPSSSVHHPSSFSVHLPTFSGSLADLAAALRAGRILPAEVPLLQLTRDVLAWVQTVTGQQPLAFAEAHPDLLPTLASVIALKARLLLPQPEPDELPEADDLLEEVVESVEALAELGALVAFLAARREQRAGILPARAAPVDFPRRQRPRNAQVSLAKLVKAAQQAVRQVDVPLLARERLTLADALAALRAFGKRLHTFTLGGVTASDWGEETTYFAALLEGVKEGQLSAEQDEPYGEIRIESRLAEG